MIFRSLPLVSCVVCLSSTAFAQSPSQTDQIGKFWAKMAKAKSVSFMVELWMPSDPDASGLYRGMEVAHNCEVLVRKPNMISIRGSAGLHKEMKDGEGAPHHEFSGSSSGNVIVSDGKRTLTLTTSLRWYDLDSVARPLNQPKPKSLGSVIHTDVLFAKNPMHGMTLSPSPKTDQDYLTFISKEANNNIGEYRTIFKTKDGSLMSISYWEQVGDKPEKIEIERASFSYWEFDSSIPMGAFDTHPPSGYRQKTIQNAETPHAQIGNKK